MKKAIGTVLFLLLLLSLFGCGKSAGNATEQEEPEEIVPEEVPEEAVEEPPEEVTLVKRPSITFDAAQEEAFQFARENVMILALGSGLGEEFELKQEDMDTLLENIELAHAPTENWHMLQRTFNKGNPKLTVKKELYYPTNYDSFLFSQVLDDGTSVQTFAATLLAETKVAKALGTSLDKEEQFLGALIGAAAAEQANFVTYNGRSGGFYKPFGVEEESRDLGAQFTMLRALSEMVDLVAEEDFVGHFRKSKAVGYANQLFTAMMQEKKKNPDLYLALDPHDWGLAILAYATFSMVTDSGKWKLFAQEQISELAELIIENMESDGKMPTGTYSQLATQATAVTGLLVAFDATDNSDYKEAALEAWSSMAELWDEEARLFETNEGDFTYTAQDIADVTQSFNVVIHLMEFEEGERFADFFNSAVKLSGLQLSEFEEDEDTVASVEEVMGAPVFATSFTYDGEEFSLKDPHFTTAEAMLLSASLVDIGTLNGDPALSDHGIPNVFSLG